MPNERHKCFISYHRSDHVEVDRFIDTFHNTNSVFIYRAVREMDQNIINSSDNDYVMRRIRELYLADSTVTIVLLGHQTWGRKYVDWEIASTLRNDPVNKRSGLMAISLPSVTTANVILPPRFEDNWDGRKKYGRWWKYPSTSTDLSMMIEEAFQARRDREALVNNSRQLLTENLVETSTNSAELFKHRKGYDAVEPLTFILGLASTVMGNILSDFITGKSHMARRVEIERLVSMELLNQSQRNNLDVKKVLQDVMREIELLSRRNPDLRVRDDRIELTKPVNIPSVAFDRQKLIQGELGNRLERLNHIIAERRAELGLLNSSDSSSAITVGEVSVAPNVPEGWEFVETSPKESKWLRAIKDTEDNIRRRRGGES